MKTVLNIAGPRYTPQLNINLPIAITFEGLGRTETFVNSLAKLNGEMRRAFARAATDETSVIAGVAILALKRIARKCDESIRSLVGDSFSEVRFKGLAHRAGRVAMAARKAVELLETASRAADSSPRDSTRGHNQKHARYCQ